MDAASSAISTAETVTPSSVSTVSCRTAPAICDVLKKMCAVVSEALSTSTLTLWQSPDTQCKIVETHCTHCEALTDPLGDVLPLAHRRHATLPISPFHVPTAHGTQANTLSAPSMSHLRFAGVRPSLHSHHACPLPAQEPSGHGMHLPMPAVGFIVASGHTEQKNPQWTAWPGGQARRKCIFLPDRSTYASSSSRNKAAPTSTFRSIINVWPSPLPMPSHER
mmetsp:Transcript_4651/g.11737  ORF Transcript_4651/g.11737 Transcript_4651/m.11737 type:complete len:222 (+) Transcript_4651:978-1643(+)